MPIASNIVLADAQGTPVNHTFIPMGKDPNGVYWFEDQSASSPIGYWKLSIEVKKPLPGAPGAKSGSDRVVRVNYALHEPALETLGTSDNGLTPPPTISYITRCTGTYIIPERSTLQNRKDIRKMISGLNDSAIMVSVVEQLQAIYG